MKHQCVCVYIYILGLNQRGWVLYNSIGRGCVEWLIYEWLHFGALCHALEYFILSLRGRGFGIG
jgi:hypothetical protein